MKTQDFIHYFNMSNVLRTSRALPPRAQSAVIHSNLENQPMRTTSTTSIQKSASEYTSQLAPSETNFKHIEETESIDYSWTKTLEDILSQQTQVTNNDEQLYLHKAHSYSPQDEAFILPILPIRHPPNA